MSFHCRLDKDLVCRRPRTLATRSPWATRTLDANSAVNARSAPCYEPPHTADPEPYADSNHERR